MLSSKFDEAEREEGAERMTKRDVIITVRATCQVLANGFNDKVFSVSTQYSSIFHRIIHR